MTTRLMQRVNVTLERRFPERRLFLRSEDHTRFICLSPGTQLVAWAGTTLTVAWMIMATTILLLDSVAAGNHRSQAQRDMSVYEDRLNALLSERDLRAAEALAAQERFTSALAQISAMQRELLASEGQARELETGLQVVHTTLRQTMVERQEARKQIEAIVATDPAGLGASEEDLIATLDLMTGALADTAAERDALGADAEAATRLAGDLDLELRGMQERNAEIFQQLEDALTISVEPLNDMFRTAGLNPDDLIEEVQRGNSGQGGPLTPIQFSTMGAPLSDDGTLRANRILDQLDQINSYRVAMERVPFGMPVQDPFRYTSGFGPRWGRMHEGTDFAAPIGTPIYATADGVVVQAGWASGYGRLIKIQHEFGMETRFAHLNAIRVEVGQRVERGERIGDMGNSGRSTGSHLHYEIRLSGDAVNPMTYIGAGNDVH